MNRRNFLKSLGVVPVLPWVNYGMENEKPNTIGVCSGPQDFIIDPNDIKSFRMGGCYATDFGWVEELPFSSEDDDYIPESCLTKGLDLELPS